MVGPYIADRAGVPLVWMPVMFCGRADLRPDLDASRKERRAHAQAQCGYRAIAVGGSRQSQYMLVGTANQIQFIDSNTTTPFARISG